MNDNGAASGRRQDENLGSVPRNPDDSGTSTDGADLIKQQMFAKLDPRNYAIACLDVLGQNRAFSELPQLLTSPSDLRAHLPVLRQTFVTVRTLRMTITGIANQMGNADNERSNDASDEYFHFDLGSFSFADTLVAYVELSTSPAARTAVCSLLQACAFAMQMSMGIHSPLRGGIDLGWASPVEPGSQELYGPGLNRAHYLESRIAEYPRIVVGPSVREFVETGTTTESDPTARSVATALAGLCREMLYIDDDGKLALDYIGRYAAEHCSHAATESGFTGRDAVSRGYSFLLEREKAFADAGDEKLAARYAKTVNYYRSRLSFWGLDGG
ncbi:MAG: hypothetical protein NTX53_04590 [candidate division WOR-3 bacterium]|nr:hypothetical protein [candidate division WOR-3 bacterium]